MNSINLIGRLTKDPEIKTTQGGKSIVNFSIAVNDGKRNGKDIAYFFECSAWEKTGEAIKNFVKKGQQIGLSGKLVQDSWDGQDGRKNYKIKILVQGFTFVGNRQDNSTNSQESNPVPESVSNNQDSSDYDDSIF
jgi:single-strand DNA-binding protein